MKLARFAGLLVLAAIPSTGPAAATPVITRCGALVNSIAKTEINFFTTNSEQPVVLAGTVVSFTVPAGASRCVKVRFSAIANCPNACFLRAFVDTVELNPKWTINPLRFAQAPQNSGVAQSFEWVGRVGAGQHAVQIKIQTGNVIANANIGPFTTVVDIQN